MPYDRITPVTAKPAADDHKTAPLHDVNFVLLTAQNVGFIGPNDKRIALIIGCPVTNRVTLHFGGKGTLLDQGINLYPGQQPLMLLYEHIGQAIREEIRASVTVANETIGFVDVFDR